MKQETKCRRKNKTEGKNNKREEKEERQVTTHKMKQEGRREESSKNVCIEKKASKSDLLQGRMKK